MERESTPPAEPADSLNRPEPPFNFAPASPFEEGSPPARVPPDISPADVQQQPPREKPPAEVELLKTASGNGQLQDVHRILTRYSLSQSPDPATGLLDLALFAESIIAAIAHEHCNVLSYLFFRRVGVPSVYVKWAIDARSRPVFEVFLKYGWDINEPVSRIDPPVLGFISHDEGLTEWFLNHGADPNTPCAWDYTPMSRAMTKASIDSIHKLFSQGGDAARGQLLHHAVLRRGPDAVGLVELLLSQGASCINDIQYEDDPAAFAEQSMLGLGTPLHYAAEEGREDLVRLLLRHGADASIRDTKGKTALEVADSRQQFAVSRAVREFGSTL